MPTRKYTKKRTYKKKTYKKRSYKKRNAIVKNPVNYIGFPKQQTVKMRYVSTFSLDLSAAAYQTHSFVCNSIFDPDAALGGHQPLGHDQWMAFYNHYTVLGAKCSVSLSGQQATNPTPVLCAIFVSDDLTSAFDPIKLAEQGRCRYKLLNGFNSINTLQLSNFYSAKKFFNVKDVKDNETRIGASFGSNPAEQAFFIIGAATVDGSTLANQEIHAIVTIDYIVSMSEPMELPQS